MTKVKVDSDIAMFSNSAKVAANSHRKKLIISTHGGWSSGDGTFTLAEVGGVAISFYASENYSVTGDIEDALKGKIHTIDQATTTVKNYELSRFEDDPKKSELVPLLPDGFDVMKVRTKWFGSRAIRLKTALQRIYNKGFRYTEICCLFCRYTGDELEMDARTRTRSEAERLDKLAKSHALTSELKTRFGRK